MIHDSLLSGSGVIIQKVSGRKQDKLLTEGAPRKDAGAEDGSGSAVLGEAMTGDKRNVSARRVPSLEDPPLGSELPLSVALLGWLWPA